LLAAAQVDFYREHGYLHIAGVFTPEETDELARELDFMMDTWANEDLGWTGPWREALMGVEMAKAAKLIAMHDMQFYSAAWARAVTKPSLAEAMSQLIGGPVELHHSTLHVKPPESGQTFPMHQDHAFYEHQDDRYVDVLVHLDDTRHENGEIRFLDGSHKQGPLRHIKVTPEGQECTPHLPTDQYRLEDSVAVPARRGDVVCFNINTIHGSYLNTTSAPRRLVRIGYRHPENHQSVGQSMGRPSPMVWGRRDRAPGQELLPGT
jgi:ectoine hydroxylase-related dioxygenase (phytanoyl-CoA dioxygenase family)